MAEGAAAVVAGSFVQGGSAAGRQGTRNNSGWVSPAAGRPPAARELATTAAGFHPLRVGASR
jgi:hypothetical protein